MPTLHCPSTPSETGAFQLSWDGPEGARYVLTEDGAVIYEGLDTATALSGRPQGSYEYALRVDGEVAVATCTVEVNPPSLELAAGFFGVGAVVFLTTLIFIMLGHRGRFR